MQRDGGPGGAGGAGNPVGGSFTGPALGLEYVGGFCYALSGLVQVGNETVLLSFRTGASLLETKFQFTLGEDTSDNIVWEIELNGTVISGSLNEASTMANPMEPVYLILPPYTEVEVHAQNFSGAPTARKCYALITGRIHRG